MSADKVMTKGELFEALKDIPDDWKIFVSARPDEADFDSSINLRNIYIERDGRNDVILVARNWGWKSYHDESSLVKSVERLFREE